MAARTGPQIEVVIADAQPIFRDGVARAVRQDRDLRLVAEVDDGHEAMEAIRRLAPQVAVTDLVLPGLDGRRVLDALNREALPTRLILLTAETRQDVAFAALAAGASGYLSKAVDGELVRRAIKRVAAGEAVLCDTLQTLMTDEIRVRHRHDRELLSNREHDVLTLIAQGMSVSQIARRLHLSPATVKGYVAQVYERLGVSERAHAVAVAMRRGLLD